MRFASALSFLTWAGVLTSTVTNAKVSTVTLRGTDREKATALNFMSAMQQMEFSSCQLNKSEGSCNGASDDKGNLCVWCKCAAIPSECLTEDQSKIVPQGVFDCARIDTDTTVVNEDSILHVTSDTENARKTVSYSLDEDEVAGELCDPNSKSIAGYMSVQGSEYDANGEDKNLFYWFFEKRTTSLIPGTEEDMKDAKEVPLIVWLTGGPGCSSTLALLTENGPCSVNKGGETTELNPYSWTETAHVLWLDQPAGVGYSYGDSTDSNEEMISEDAYYFLQAFYQKHPEYQENPLFVVGESYGGHYAPAIAHKIWLKNQGELGNNMVKVNLSGLAIGNGLTNPIEQYKWYPEMAFKNSHNIQVISEREYDAMKDAVPKCVKLIEVCNKGSNFVNSFACQSAFMVCNMSLTSPYQATGLNPYDIRKECGSHPLCYDFSDVETFLNLDETKSSLHISEKSHHWESCNMGINMKFHTDWMKDFSPYVKDLLNDGIPALIYAGDVDFICNYLGNKAWTLNLEWDHKTEFNDAEEHEWGTSGTDSGAAGLARTSNGFTFLQVYDAGHMVPSDQPSVALDMIRNFVVGGQF